MLEVIDAVLGKGAQVAVGRIAGVGAVPGVLQVLVGEPSARRRLGVRGIGEVVDRCGGGRGLFADRQGWVGIRLWSVPGGFLLGGRFGLTRMQVIGAGGVVVGVWQEWFWGVCPSITAGVLGDCGVMLCGWRVDDRDGGGLGFLCDLVALAMGGGWLRRLARSCLVVAGRS
ncbi:hypothetical protein DQ384_36535 [Sphaerisporangium album]|uniref:Uncharacterized protein n=1 Tax=Sphaerisporangium album TaxID=509200 RepID=A0A367ESM8_9ACTN|nr:hypothetical protein DQ384_36535 [Sphaerisporangium album]